MIKYNSLNLLLFPGNSAGVLEPLALASTPHVDPGEDHGQLRPLEFDAIAFGSAEPLERPAFESLVPNDQAVTVKIEDLDSISASVEEEEEMAGQKVLPEALLVQPRKPVEAFSHVGRSGTEEHAHRRGELREHQSAPRARLWNRPATRIAMRSNSGSTTPVSRTTQALAKTISSCPAEPGSTSDTGRKVEVAVGAPLLAGVDFAAGRGVAADVSRKRRFQE
jgi:hypothetical protein